LAVAYKGVIKEG